MRVAMYYNNNDVRIEKMPIPEIDDNELTTPGMKFYQSERLGIPLRIEIGQKEFANKTLTINTSSC